MMEQADRLLFVASALHESNDITRAERLRLCAELDKIAVTVRRMERMLDEAAGSAHDDALMARAQSEVTLLRPARPARRVLRLVSAR